VSLFGAIPDENVVNLEIFACFGSAFIAHVRIGNGISVNPHVDIAHKTAHKWTEL